MDDKTLALIFWWGRFASCLLMVILVIFAPWWLRLAGIVLWAYLMNFKIKWRNNMTNEQKKQREFLNMFAAYLTSINPAVKIGHDQPTPIVFELLGRFYEMHGLTEDKK